MPVHPHLADLTVLGLTKDRAPRVDPFTRTAAPIRAPKLGCEPGTSDVDLPGLERHLRLIGGHVAPIGADRLEARAGLAEGSFAEHGVGSEYRCDFVDCAALPSAAKCFQQLTIGLLHRANIRQSGTPGWDVWYTKANLSPYRTQEDGRC